MPIPLRLGGLTPLSTIDYPGELAAVVFCQGCPWRCQYCQNSELLNSSADTEIDWEDVLAFLERRRGLLDAVVFSGGEPTLQRGLGEAIAQIRTLGFKIGLHTAGCYPDRLTELLAVVDWIGLDIKSLPEHYVDLTLVEGSGAAAWTSLQRVVASRVKYEVRITIHPTLMPTDRLRVLVRQLAQAGVVHLALQGCRTESLQSLALTPEITTIARENADLFDHVTLR